MLQLSGNSEVAFAEKDSIQAAPIVYVEWNYNNIERPYIVSSTFNGNIDANGNLLVASSWVSTASVYGQNAGAGTGLYSTTDTTASAILLNTGTSNTATFTSANISVTPQTNGYYKLVFYVKANQPVVSVAATPISGSTIVGGGVNVNSPVIAATTGPFSNIAYSGLDTIYSLNNGGLTIDNQTMSLNNLVLVKNEADSTKNGIYQVTASGDATHSWKLVRPTTFLNASAMGFGNGFYVTGGLYNSNTFWVESTYGTSTAYPGGINFGVDPIVFQQSSTYFNPTALSTPNDNRTILTSSYSYPYNSNYSDLYPTSQVFLGTGSTVYYRIIPLNADGSHPPKDLDGYDIAGITVKSTASGQSLGGIIAWPNNNNALAYNIYRGFTSYSLTYLESVGAAATTSPSNVFIDNYLLSSNDIEAYPVQSTNIRIIPTINMFYNGSPIEYNNYYVKVYSDPFSEADINRGVVLIDGVNYQKVEVYFGSPQIFNSFNINIDISSTYSNSSIYIYRPQVYQTDQWNFLYSQYYPVEDLFNANRPGESLLNPFLQQKDKQINSDILSPLVQKTRPISYISYNPDFFYSSISPYKQMYDSTLNNVVRYYVSDTNNVLGGTAATQIEARYNNYMSVNKIVIKGSNAFSDLTSSSGTVQLLTLAGNTSIPFGPTASGGAGTFDESGLLVLYFNGLSWQNTRPSTSAYYPPQLSDSGVLENIVPNVYGMQLNIANVGPGSTYIGGDTVPTRVQLIELSPRLEIDISSNVTSIEVDTTIDNATSANGFPIGYINSNTAKININNIPVYKNNLPHTMWEPFATNNTTFSSLMRQNVKFTGALQSLTGDFTDIVPLFCMYSNDWQVNDLNTVEVDVYDYAKAIMMVARSPDYFGYNENMFYTITNIFDAIGFTDYDYDRLKTIMSRRATETTSFWCDRTNDIYDDIRGFFVAHQIGAWFDSYGIMRFDDLDAIIAKYFDDIPADFMITDIDYLFTDSHGASLKYSPNIVSTTLQTQVNPKIGQISLSYQTPLRAFTFGFNSMNNSTQQDQPYTLWSESGDVGLPFSFADKSVLYKDNYFWSNPERTNMMSPGTTPRYTLGGQAADGFLQGELVNWSGLEYYFVPTLGLNNAPLSPLYSNGFTEIVTTPADVQNYVNYFAGQDPRINQVEYNFTGNVIGVSRGQRFTSVRNHYLFHAGGPEDGYNTSPDNYFSRYKITSQYGIHATSNTSYNPEGSDVLMDHNIAVFSLKNNNGGLTYPTAIGPYKNSTINDIGELNVPKSASSFNYFSFGFSAPNFAGIKKKSWSHKNPRQLQVGLHIDTTVTGTSTPLLFMLQNYEGSTQLVSNTNNYSVDGPEGIGNPFTVKNVFDGLTHRFTAVFSNQPTYFSTSQPDSTGKMSYQYVTFFIDDNQYGPYKIYSKNNPTSVVPASQFGFAGNVTGTGVSNNSGTSKNPYTVKLYEIYACKWFDYNGGGGIYIKPHSNPWHWQCPLFLNGLLGNDPTIEPPYFFWGPNVITGVQFYDNVQFTTSPAFGNSLTYNYAGYDPGTWPNAVGPTLGVTNSQSITESTLYATPFRAKFAVVNSDAELVALSTSTGQVNNGQFTPFQLQGFYNKQTDAVTIEKTIDSSNILNTIELTTEWIQSDFDANQLMIKLALLAHAFNAQLSVTIFGNPLIEVGDICQVIYSLKNIGYNPDLLVSSNSSGGNITDSYSPATTNPAFFYVTGTTQKWGSSGDSNSIGLETDVQLIPLIYLPS